MKIDDSLLKEQQWSGMFHPQGLPGKAFTGTLKFSPTEGLALAFLMPYGLFEGEEEFDCLHGSLMGGEPCTLVGVFKPALFGMSMKNGYTYQTHSEYKFRFAIFGAHCGASETFDSFEFKITGLDEFLLPKRSVEDTPYQGGGILKANIDSGELTIFHLASFSFAPRDIRSFLYTRDDKAALDELQGAYEEVMGRYKNFRPFYKKSISHELKMELGDEIDVAAGYRKMARIADLFSLFFMGPSRVERMRAKVKDQDGREVSLPIFPSTLIGRDTLDRVMMELSFDHIPINSTELDLARAIGTWESIADSRNILTSSLQGKGQTVSTYEALSAILMSVTQLEDLAYQAGAKERRFSYAADLYATNGLKNLLCRFLSCDMDNIGVAISDLRNEIAHPLKPRKILPSIKLRELISVNDLLETIVACSALDEIGVSVESRDVFQNRIVQAIARHSRR